MMNNGKNQEKRSAPLINLLANVCLPTMIFLALVLFTKTEGGQSKFGIAIFGLLILIPLGAMISIFCSISMRVQTLESGSQNTSYLKSKPILFLLIFFFISIITVTLMALGDYLGFYGIIISWLLIWIGFRLSLNHFSRKEE